MSENTACNDRHDNLVLIGCHLWDNPSKRAKTSFCCHVEEELPRTENISVYSFNKCVLGIKNNVPYVQLPDGGILRDSDDTLPEWALCYCVPPRAVYMLEQMGITCYSSYEMMITTEDKMMSHVLYADCFKQPDTNFYRSDDDMANLILDGSRSCEMYPFMAKGVGGNGGENVEKIDDASDLFGFLENNDAHEDAYDGGCNMFQELMPTADDLRVYVLGDEVIGAVVRRAASGEWHANLAYSPTHELYELNENEMMEIEAALDKLPKHCRGLHVYDFLFDEEGRLVFGESNCNVATTALDVMGIGDDIFLRYVDYIERDMAEMRAEGVL